MSKILVTRPFQYASSLSERLRGEGYGVFQEPLLRIEPLSNPVPVGGVDAVLVTSRSALIAVEERKNEIADFLKLPCYCAGERTAKAASDFGFGDAKIYDEEELRRCSSVLHIRGADVAGGEMNRNVVAWIVYKAEAAENLSSELSEEIRRGCIDAVLLFSARSGDIFVELALKGGLGACCGNLFAIGINEAAIKAAGAVNLRGAAFAEKPDEDSVVKRLKEIIPVRR